jgi:hypothetical protein
MKAPHASAGSPHDGAESVERFAEKNAISRAQAFKEISSGRLIARKVGTRTIITHEDAARWRRSLPKAAAKNAAGARTRSTSLLAWMQETENLQLGGPSQRSTPTKTGETK